MILLSTSLSLQKHLRQCLDGHEEVVIASTLKGIPDTGVGTADVVVVHASMFGGDAADGLIEQLTAGPARVAIASDAPSVEEFLRVSALGARAYVNAYMADLHYLQMLQMVRAGQTWVVPPILDNALALARRAEAPSRQLAGLELLTPREREVAMDAVGGRANAEIAERLGIAEPTVKVHLGRVFKKLEVKNRFELAVKLQGLRKAS